MATRVVLALIAAALFGGEASAQYVYQPDTDYYENDTAKGTVGGGAFGAITGALIGSKSGDAGEGALIGAGVGAIAGNLFGRSKDQEDERRAAAGYAATARANSQAAALAVTNLDLIQMTAAGLDDSVIVGAIRSRGGRFDLSPEGLIALKQNGVSDGVVRAAQNAVAATPQTTIVTPPPRPAPTSTLIIAPTYRRPVYYRPPPRPYGPYGRRRW